MEYTSWLVPELEVFYILRCGALSFPVYTTSDGSHMHRNQGSRGAVDWQVEQVCIYALLCSLLCDLGQDVEPF